MNRGEVSMKTLMLLAVAAAAIPGTALLAKPAKEQARPQAFEALVRCRGVADPAQRLACFDSASAAMEEQAQKRELVVVDRQQMRDTRRKLFGLDIPDLNPFGGGGGGDAEREEEVKTVEGVVASAYQDGDGRWVVRLEDGATWAQTDNNPMALRPRPGHKVTINRAAMGSYMMKVNNQPSVRAKRRV
jgi:hypothetical protein